MRRTPNMCIVGVWLTLNYTFYCLSTFVDTTLLPSVHFCGHRAIYCLSTFVDTSYTRQRKIPVYWNLHRRSFLIKRGKIALLPSVTAKTCCTSFPARAEKVEFSRPSLLRLNTSSARKEGKTEPQASRACKWQGVPLKRHRKMP